MSENQLPPYMKPEKAYYEIKPKIPIHIRLLMILICIAPLLLIIGLSTLGKYVFPTSFTQLFLLAWMFVLVSCFQILRAPSHKRTRPVMIAFALVLFSVGFITLTAFIELSPNIESLSIALGLVSIYCFAYLSGKLSGRSVGTSQPLVRTPYLVMGWFIMIGMGFLLVLQPFTETSYEEIHGHKDLTSVAPGIALLIISCFILVEIYRRNKSGEASEETAD